MTFTEIVNSKAGFRNRPMQVFLFLVTGAALGTAFQIIGHTFLHLPETVVALLIICCLFAVFEWTGKYFAPAGALALIPLIVPPRGCALAASASCCGRCPVHRYRYACVPAMLQVE